MENSRRHYRVGEGSDMTPERRQQLEMDMNSTITDEEKAEGYHWRKGKLVSPEDELKPVDRTMFLLIWAWLIALLAIIVIIALRATHG